MTRPAEISDGVSLSDKLGRAVWAFVAEERALDALLPVRAVLGMSPNKDGVAVVGSQDDVVPRADELALLRPLVAAGVVFLKEFEAGDIAVFR